MKIALTGGSSGGHFYPLIAVADAIREIEEKEKLVPTELFYFGPEKYNERMLFERNITFVQVKAGKMRVYFSLLNFLDVFKTILGAFQAVLKLWSVYPDVVFSKGSFTSFPVVFAARILRIPVVIHESDTVPGRANKFAASFAKRIAISYPSAVEYFPKKNIVAHTGNPIRKELLIPEQNGAHEHFKLEPDVPVLLVLGGSQGSQIINETILSALPTLLPEVQVIHQVGKNNDEETKSLSDVILHSVPEKKRYHQFAYLPVLDMKYAAGVADVVITRAGSTLFEVAQWQLPSIIVPISKSNGDHQRKNAYAYARSGAGHVIEEVNLSPNIVVAEIRRIISDSKLKESMKLAAKDFSRPHAAELIAQELIRVAIAH
ncbi:MAG: UDP-N-acetylglucosamine--N-acetylmuramyl-(pentapeptide) pyrophosphoryl-undecaprenol N-acetylglucosamine transferase [Candidatus Paceibacterota bacterium]